MEDNSLFYRTETTKDGSKRGKGLLNRLFRRGTSSNSKLAALRPDGELVPATTRGDRPNGLTCRGPWCWDHHDTSSIYNLSMVNHAASMTTTVSRGGGGTTTTPRAASGATTKSGSSTLNNQDSNTKQATYPQEKGPVSASPSWEDKEDELREFHRDCRNAQLLNLRRAQETLQSMPWILQKPVDAIGSRPLHVLCSHQPSLQAVQLFVALADCTPPPQVIANHQGWLPLHSAWAHRAWLDVVEFLTLFFE